METFSFKILIRDSPVFKKIAKQLGVDLITEPFQQGDEWVTAHALLPDLDTLVSIAFLAGSEAEYLSIKNPLNQLIASLESKIDNMLKPNKDDNNKL